MSAYITIGTPMLDEECLVAALEDLGFARAHIEVHAEPAALVGYQGDRREQKANVVIRRQHVGRASNDLGFLATATGYLALVSGYDHPRFGSGWLATLHACYQARWKTKEARLEAEAGRQAEEARIRLVEAQRIAVHERAKKLGYRVEESREGDVVRIVLVKRTY